MKIVYLLKASILFIFLSFFSCASDDSSTEETNTIENPTEQVTPKSSESLATNGCSNVVIFNNYAYAACGEQLEIVSLSDGKRNIVSIASNDITIDPSNETLFIQARNQISALSIENPINPTVITTSTTNFGIFSGIDAANGIIVISAGVRGSNTQVYTYTNNTFNLATDGIAAIDNVTGNPDVHITETTNGARAFYSQDLGSVANWGIQIVDFNNTGTVVNTEDVVTLTPQRLTGGFSTISPANFPVEGEFLNNKFYVAHFAANGIEVIDLDNNNTLSQISLGFQPINITTDGTSLFAVGISNKTVSIINPTNNEITTTSVGKLQQPRGIAVSQDYIAVADRIEGLVISKR